VQRLPTGGQLEEDDSTTLLITADTVFCINYCLFQLYIIDNTCMTLVFLLRIISVLLYLCSDLRKLILTDTIVQSAHILVAVYNHINSLIFIKEYLS